MRKFFKNPYFKAAFPLALVSFLLLFLELLVVRLVGTEIRIFAYLSNLTLLAIFVGSGIGMILKRRLPVELTSFLLFLLTVVVSVSYIARLPNLEFKLFSGVTELLSPLSEDYIWLQVHTFSKTGIAIGFGLTIGLVLLIALIFVPLGQVLGELMDRDKRPLRAYSVNVFASTIGMWGFYVFSLLRLPPVLGIIMVQVLLLFLVKAPLAKYFLGAMMAVTIALTIPKTSLQPYQGAVNYWSPYQKLTLSPIYPPDNHPGGYYLEVNNVGYMGLLDLDKTHQATISAIFADNPNFKFGDHYSLPYFLKPDAKSVLIVGAGAGNDAAAALRANIPRVEAVEIDPLIVEIGEKFHPERPYDDSRVHITVDDGRAFYTRTKEKYDVIVMALADSHTLGSSLTNLRLDNYLYTLESLSKAQSLLADDGILFVNFEATRPWIGGHIKNTLTQAFGHPPTIFEARSNGYYGWGSFAFVSSKEEGRVMELAQQQPGLAKYIAANSRDFPKAEALSDSWPYLYFPGRKIPLIHLIVAAILIAILLIARLTVMSRGRFQWNFFFLGAAFLLFEFQNVTKTSLLFGVTWITNLFTITAILLLILLANLVVTKINLSGRVIYLLLAISFAVQFLVPVSAFNTLEFAPKLIVSSIILNLPIFFAGVIFAQKFKETKDRSGAFGSNLIGSAVGGLAEMLSFVFGIQALIVVSIVFYVGAYLTSLRK